MILNYSNLYVLLLYGICAKCNHDKYFLTCNYSFYLLRKIINLVATEKNITNQEKRNIVGIQTLTGNCNYQYTWPVTHVLVQWRKYTCISVCSSDETFC